MAGTGAPEKVTLPDIYREQRNFHGRMHDTFYMMPPAFATVIGGLWYFAAQYLSKDKMISIGVFLFAAACSLMFLSAMQRYRLMLRAYVAHINKLDHEFSVITPTTAVPRTGTALMVLLLLALVMSVGGALYAAADGRAVAPPASSVSITVSEP